ncbi:MAG: tRNA (N(6)-L-threonylcarbamoyladenosine(37)-C(2))-methylthiotransferase MtaB [Treponema sp.]
MMNLFTIRIETLGCRLNQTESEGLAFIFANEGFPIFSKTISENDVCLCIVNTCTVTSKAEQKARRLIRLLLKTHKNACVLVTGCYAELESKTIEAINERVISFSGKKKDELSYLPSFIKEYLTSIDHFSIEKTKTILLDFKKKYDLERKTIAFRSVASSSFTQFFSLSSPNFMFHSRATLKVQDGCNNACSFCRIRLARGKAISLPIDEAIRRLKEIEEKGANEVVLTGVNLSQYESNGFNFTHLLKALLVNTQHIRIRISSLYPETITDEIIPIISEERICPHFHLSIQSGSNEILKKMNRRYRKEDVYVAVERIRKAKEKPFIGADIITGFPSESEKDFYETISMCKSLQFTGIHAFPFSARPGTQAFNMEEKIAERIACQRVELLNQIAKVNYDEYLKLCQNDEVFAIVEIDSSNKLYVTTENYLHLPLISTQNHHAGDEVKVKIQNNEAYFL